MADVTTEDEHNFDDDHVEIHADESDKLFHIAYGIDEEDDETTLSPVTSSSSSSSYSTSIDSDTDSGKIGDIEDNIDDNEDTEVMAERDITSTSTTINTTNNAINLTRKQNKTVLLVSSDEKEREELNENKSSRNHKNSKSGHWEYSKKHHDNNCNQSSARRSRARPTAHVHGNKQMTLPPPPPHALRLPNSESKLKKDSFIEKEDIKQKKNTALDDYDRYFTKNVVKMQSEPMHEKHSTDNYSGRGHSQSRSFNNICEPRCDKQNDLWMNMDSKTKEFVQCLTQEKKDVFKLKKYDCTCTKNMEYWENDPFGKWVCGVKKCQNMKNGGCVSNKQSSYGGYSKDYRNGTYKDVNRRRCTDDEGKGTKIYQSAKPNYNSYRSTSNAEYNNYSQHHYQLPNCYARQRYDRGKGVSQGKHKSMGYRQQYSNYQNGDYDMEQQYSYSRNKDYDFRMNMQHHNWQQQYTFRDQPY